MLDSIHGQAYTFSLSHTFALVGDEEEASHHVVQLYGGVAVELSF